jgi:hypothetical protein
MFFRLSTGRRIALFDAVHGIRRLHGSNMTSLYWSDAKRDILELKKAFDVFFTNEGQSLGSVESLRARVYLNLGKRAYWSGLSHLARGRSSEGIELLKLAFSFSPRLAVLPPIDYLLLLENPLQHVLKRLAEASIRSNLKAAS